LKCKVIEAVVNEDDNSFFLTDLKWNLDSKSLKEKEVSENKGNDKHLSNIINVQI
jgi:hypothetical protein